MIEEAEVERLRSQLGKTVQVAEPPYLTEVTSDAARHWALATGDRNQLYTDESYARRSIHGALLAPPTILYAFSRLAIGYRGGLPGVHSMFGGSHWKWNRPILVGERISCTVVFKDLIEKTGRFAGRMFKQVSQIDFKDEHGQLVAEAESWGFRTGRVSAQRKAKYSDLAQKHYTAVELKEIAALYRAEACRGPLPLYWDDVLVGDALPGIIRGPYTATTAVAFEQAWGGLFIHAHGYWYEYLARHPHAAINNEQGVPEPPEAVHWDSALARSVGVPGAYDYGPERISWVASMITNWLGDSGFLSELYCEVRRFNVVGDLTYCLGAVTDKTEVSPTVGALRIELGSKNQRDASTLKGWAIVHVPKRGSQDGNPLSSMPSGDV